MQRMDSDKLKYAISIAKGYNCAEAVYYVLYYLDKIYHDGYEEEALNELAINDNSFIFKYGEKDFGRAIKWKKAFFQRLFSLNNKDELESIPNYLKI
ncbi:hypothetical protein [Tissierella sp. P1]|uniref:hypothetical protein n=1 Tax=Tissierella sp. P1 TaxID=1280483 RepID=UPI003519C8F2